MADRSRFFDDIAGVAGGAFSAFTGLRDEAESTLRARVDEVIRKLDLVKREELDAVQEMAATARAAQERAEQRLVALEARVGIVEAGRSAATPTTGVVASVPDVSVDGAQSPPGVMPAGSGVGGAAVVPPSLK